MCGAPLASSLCWSTGRRASATPATALPAGTAADFLPDRAARRRLNISVEEFMRRWDAGEYVGKADRADVAHVAMLLPFGR